MKISCSGGPCHGLTVSEELGDVWPAAVYSDIDYCKIGYYYKVKSGDWFKYDWNPFEEEYEKVEYTRKNGRRSG